MDNAADAAVIIGLSLVVLVGTIWLYIILPAQMARSRNRSVFGWILISLIASPVLSLLALLYLGRRGPGPDA